MRASKTSPKGTIKNSASKVIESSVATEIETKVGVLTLDGKSGVDLQADGTKIIGNLKPDIRNLKGPYIIFIENEDNQFVSRIKVLDQRDELIGFVAMAYKNEAVNSSLKTLKVELFTVSVISLIIITLILKR